MTTDKGVTDSTKPTLLLYGHRTLRMPSDPLGHIAKAAFSSFEVNDVRMSCRAPNIDGAFGAVRGKKGFFLLGLSAVSAGEDSAGRSFESQAVSILPLMSDFGFGLVTTDVDYLRSTPYLQALRYRNLVRLVVLCCERGGADCFHEVVAERFPNVGNEQILYFEHFGTDCRTAPLVADEIKKLVA